MPRFCAFDPAMAACRLKALGGWPGLFVQIEGAVKTEGNGFMRATQREIATTANCGRHVGWNVKPREAFCVRNIRLTQTRRIKY
jgi:hypothetical protein